jgi:hypothetical protein
MHGEILLVVLILTIGCAAFFFCVVYLIGRGFLLVGRGLAGLFRRASDGATLEAGGRACRVCPREQCRKLEHRPARFCSQCGARLSEAPDQAPF